MSGSFEWFLKSVLITFLYSYPVLKAVVALHRGMCYITLSFKIVYSEWKVRFYSYEVSMVYPIRSIFYLVYIYHNWISNIYKYIINYLVTLSIVDSLRTKPLYIIFSYSSFSSAVSESICSLFLTAAFLSINQTHISTGCIFHVWLTIYTDAKSR